MGWLVGIAIFFVPFALGGLGAGDVKLLAMVGAFVGAGDILAVAIATLLAGGVLALAWALWQGSLRQLLGNALQMVLHSGLSGLSGGALQVQAPAAASGRLPYAVAIAVATAGCVIWLRTFGELPL